MCGIAGATEPGDQSAVTAMLQRLAHRGADGMGIWTDPSCQITLGCVRLATTDPRITANQPLATDDGRFILAFNGYIAGHRRKIRDAISDGLTFGSQSDAELVLQLLANGIRRGQDPARVLETLSGQYAVALWDRVQACLWLARDPLGIKPLYVLAHAKGHIAFASEIAAFEPVATLVPDRTIKAAYLAHLFGPAPKTGFKDIDLLAPGTVMGWEGGKITTARIAHPVHKTRQVTEPATLLSAVRQSVADAMDADCNVGCLVSGGLDSAGVSALACDIARERGQKSPMAFVMGFDDPALDETDAAKRLCKHLGQELHVVPAPTTPADIHRELCAGLRSVGGPFGNPSIVLMGCLAKAVGKQVKVCLSGDGGDELFGGYPRYRAAQFYDRFWRHVPRPLRQVAASLSEIGHHRELHRFLSGASAGRDHAFDIWNNRCPIPACEARLTSQPGLENGLTTAMMEFDRDVTLPGNQLVMSDRCGMAHGVEYRLPLLGHDVVRIAASAPTSQHLEHGPKTVWRQAITSYLPAGHVENGKIGFNPPVAKWLGELARYLWGNEADILEAVFADIAISSAAKVTCWRQAVSGKDLDMALGVWALMVWQIWLGLDQSNARGTADTA